MCRPQNCVRADADQVLEEVVIAARGSEAINPSRDDILNA